MIFLDEVSSDVIFYRLIFLDRKPTSERIPLYESDDLSGRGVFGRDFSPVKFFGSKFRRQQGECITNLVIFLDEVCSDVIFDRSNFSDRKSDVRKESALGI